MNLLVESESRAFLDRFYCFDDGVIRSVETIYPYAWFTKPGPATAEQKRVRVLLSAVDRQAKNDWCNVSIELQGVTELKLDEPNDGYHSVLSDGLKLGWFDGLVFVDFSLDDQNLKSADEFRKAHRYAAGVRLLWQVEPYDR